MDDLFLLRRELHRNPELSGHERGTGKRVRFYLKQHRPDEIITDIAGEGMAAVYKAPEDGPTLLFRSDLDALPINETASIPYKSINKNISHACGHDGHMAIVSGLSATILWNPIKRGRVVLFFQPESETGQGALKSIAELKKLGISADYSFAIHNMPKYDLGTVVLGKHTFSSASKGLIIKLIGKESHAAYPENGINPSLAVAELIQKVDSISGKNSFNDFILATIIHVRVGEVAFGTSPGYAEVMITLRSFCNSDMEKLSKETVDLARAVGHKFELAVETIFTDNFPASVCDQELTKVLDVLSKKQNRKVTYLEQPNRWAEDFSNFCLSGPSLIFGLGIGNDLPELHSPNFDFPDDAIKHGVEIFDEIISHYLR